MLNGLQKTKIFVGPKAQLKAQQYIDSIRAPIETWCPTVNGQIPMPETWEAIVAEQQKEDLQGL